VRNIASISDDIYLAVNKTGLHTLDFDFTNDSKIPYTNKDLEQLPITNFATYAYGSGINTYGENRINCFAPFRLNGSVATENINGYTIYNTDGSIARSASGGKTISANDEIVVIFTQTPDTAKIEFAKETYEYSKYECSVFGDSLTADAPYYPYLATLTDLQIKNCGKGGSRVSGSASTCMNNDARINTLEGNFIVIMGGTNDCQTASVGEVSMSNCDIDTFVGAYNTMLSKIYYRYGISDGYYSDIDYSGVTKLDEAVFPNIILVTPPKAFASENQYQKLGEFGEYVKQIAKMWGLPCVDAYNNMQMSWANTSEFFDDISKDGTHYNSKGCSKLASLIANKFNECYANFNSQN
jgi:hypothetical protein